MKLMLGSVGVALAAIMAVFAYGAVRAEMAPGVRIVLVQAAGIDAKYERIDIENQANQPVDVTGWRLGYKSASGGTATSLIQLAPAQNWHTFLDSGKRETFVSKELAAASTDAAIRTAVQFTGGLNHLGGSLQLYDANGTLVDMVGWGTASEAVRQGAAASAMTATTWLVRHGATGGNSVDFTLETQAPLLTPVVTGSLYDVLDVCANIPGIQQQVPDDYQASGADCQPIDACQNIDGVQAGLPTGMEYDVAGNCQPIDVCLNLDGIQASMPTGYEPVAGRQCAVMIPARHLLITELLPNPSGSDTGNEFIELYNAENEAVSLGDYQVVVGSKTYALPADKNIQPGEYLTLSDTDLGLALPNTTGVDVWLTTVRGVEVASAPAYANAPDDASWALVDGTWQYTYAPTPGGTNQAMAHPPCQAGYERDDATRRCRKVEQVAVAAVAPCREGQYRSDETGRCRSVASVVTLVPCKEGQYRSEETNRCRSFASLTSSVLRPCADDQFRNPLTNRCKSIASSDDVALADCGEGRERNPTTHRCRNVVSATVPAAAFAVAPIKDMATAFAGWWALGGVGVLALGYAGWEWRHEAINLIRRASAFLGRR